MALCFSFLSGFFLTYLNSFQIRFTLWVFLALVVCLPILIEKVPFLREKGLFIFSSFMGGCAGLTGMGGGIVLSSFFHESGKIPTKNIPAVVSVILFFISAFSLLGQTSRLGWLFVFSEIREFYFFLLFISSFLGLFAGYLFNLRQKDVFWRKVFLRGSVGLMFLSLTTELLGWSF